MLEGVNCRHRGTVSAGVRPVSAATMAVHPSDTPAAYPSRINLRGSNRQTFVDRWDGPTREIQTNRQGAGLPLGRSPAADRLPCVRDAWQGESGPRGSFRPSFLDHWIRWTSWDTLAFCGKNDDQVAHCRAPQRPFLASRSPQNRYKSALSPQIAVAQCQGPYCWAKLVPLEREDMLPVKCRRNNNPQNDDSGRRKSPSVTA